MHIDGDRDPPVVDAGTDSWARGIEVVVTSLDARLGRRIERTAIRAEVEAGFAAHSDARIRDFVPLLVERRVRARFLEQASP